MQFLLLKMVPPSTRLIKTVSQDDRINQVLKPQNTSGTEEFNVWPDL